MLLLASIGLPIAAALLHFVEGVRRHLHDRVATVLVVVLTVLAAVAGLLALIVPPPVQQGQDF